MEKLYPVTGFCPKRNKDIRVNALYIYDYDHWEKGVPEPPCSFPCEDGCPILASAPAELRHL